MDEKYNNIDPIYEPINQTNEAASSASDQDSPIIDADYEPVEQTYERRSYHPDVTSDYGSTQKTYDYESSTYRPYKPIHSFDPFDEEEYYGRDNETTTATQTPPVEPPQNKPRKRFRFFRFVAMFVVFVFLGGIVFGAGYTTAIYLGSELTPELVQAEPQTLSFDVNQIENVVSTTTTEEAGSSIVTIAETAGPSVVTISSTVEVQFNSFFGTQSQTQTGTGSGVMYKITDDDLLIVTNHHVIEDASRVQVTMHDGITLDAEVVGYNSKMDLAVLSIPLIRLEEEGSQDITVATFGDSEALKVGEIAVAIGNPLGARFSSTVTAGVISAVDRELNINGTNLTMLQTDAAINPGNSGGALVNSKGEVIGINTAKQVDESVEGMGFSIPIHLAIPVINAIEESGEGNDIAVFESDRELTPDKPFLGVSISDITNEIFAETQMPFGVYITYVFPNSGAEAAGIQTGDVLYSIDGTRLMTSDDLFDILSTKEVGDTIKISLSRDEENIQVEATLTRYGDVITD